MVKLVDTRDLKSLGVRPIRVQLPVRASFLVTLFHEDAIKIQGETVH